jgi:YegS/Rv2252/BmrU family lipid kinase
MMRAHAIVNPTAGGGRSVRAWNQIAPILREAGWRVTETVTAHRGHARELALDTTSDVVMAVGGDGTVHEVANGLLSVKRRATMAVVPVGTANDFARALGMPRDPLAAAAALLTAETRTVDVGQVNGRYFVTIAGAGFDGEVARAVNAWPKWFGGHVMYVLGILKTLATYQTTEAEIIVDAGAAARERLFLFAVGNTAWNAGGMRLVPAARMDDGLLHAVVAGPLGRLETLTVLPRVFSGTHVNHRKLWETSGRELRVTAARPLVVQADGEIVGTLPATFTVHPGALSVLAPHSSTR